MTIAERISEIKNELPANVTLVAVSKTKPSTMIQEAYNAGQRHFGENKVQEMVDKYSSLPNDIHWHLIGHLQTNKVKYIAPFVSLIHSVDSLKLLIEINKQAMKFDRIINCLLQFHIAEEETKFGLSEEEGINLVSDPLLNTLQNINVIGVMGMASFTENTEQVRSEFAHLKHIFEGLKKDHFSKKNDFKEISMGMSGDYELAIEEGSTMIRVGSSIFGDR